MKVTTEGRDLAKNVFQLDGVNEFGKTIIKKQIRCDQMAEFLVNLPSALPAWRPAVVHIESPWV